MSALDAANAYFDAWNKRDAAAILASLSPKGTYCDPLTRGPINGEAIKAYVVGLWTAFPDLNFEIKSAAETGDDRVAAEWIMRGTNSGPFSGLPPTGKCVETTGADFIQTDQGKVSSVVGYFDGGEVPRQLGLQIVVQPHEIGPFKFGTSTAVQTGATDAPVAFGITHLEARDDDAALRVRDMSRDYMMELMQTPGFIGAVTAKIGQRMITMSAWSDTSAMSASVRKGAHGAAMKPFYEGSIASSGFTSVWSPARINPYWIRCTACGSMVDTNKHSKACTCGASLPNHPPYW